MTQCDYRAFYHDSPNKPRPAGLPYQIIFCQLDEGHSGGHEGIATLPDGTVWFRPSRAEFDGDRRNANRWDLEHGDE